ncbi:TetR/AcrR family transcriptional regulator C-terminal domain-containing protein [Plantactinospora endophytica]|uniref:GntR family transcriptional regulator n=1 Tax=Plantactinospora endophytica TaxID=673535 RepID=A0ABQ4E4C4_9ACTN|nr:GntR family transcriptional regulator [Plantactinospora endophytica]GIG89554.1 GntR family transcriptional regulator [Plantactinospora endophytica]
MPTTAEPPYLRIVREIRRRIADGELQPGDRVPSTRQLASEWNVAIATATRALTTLSQQGVVRAQPRVGTVVAAPEPAPARPRRRVDQTPPRSAAGLPSPGPRSEPELTRDRVVRAALDIADAEGLEALSMRGVAARLGVATMSPYRYVHSKEDLVLLMADTAYGERGYPEPHPTGWRERLELGARTLWALHRQHPWLAQLSPLTRPLPLPNLMVHGEWVLAALDGLGLDPATMLDLNVLVYSFVQGLAVHLERETQARAATGITEEEWIERQGPAIDALAESGGHPTYARVLESFTRTGYDLDLDRLFETGLRALLDGFTVLVGDRAE